MARPKKSQYTYLKDKRLYQKKIKDSDGKYFCLYAPTPEELPRKIQAAELRVKEALLARENPIFAQYARRWMSINSGSISTATKADYPYVIDRFLIPRLGQIDIRKITPDDCKEVVADGK